MQIPGKVVFRVNWKNFLPQNQAPPIDSFLPMSTTEAPPPLFSSFTDFISALRGRSGKSFDVQERVAGMLGSWLKYSAFIDEKNVFVNDDSVSFALEVHPQTGANEEMGQILAALFNNAPPDTGIQIQLLGSPRLEELFHAYIEQRVPDAELEKYLPTRERWAGNPYREMARRRTTYLQKARQKTFGPAVGSLIRNFRCVVSVTMHGDATDPVFLDALEMQRSGMESTLKAANLPSRRWTAGDLVNWCANLLNPQRLYADCQPLNHDGYKEIRHQIMGLDTRTSVRKDKIVLWRGETDEHVAVRTLTVRNYPESFAIWGMNFLIGDVFQSSLQYGCPFLITIAAQMPNRDAVKNKVQLRQARATQNSESPIARFMPAFAQQKRDWDAALKSLDQGGQLVELYHSITLFATNETLAREDQVTRAIWASKGFVLSSMEMIQLPALIMSLPMTFSKGMFKDASLLKLCTTKTTHNAVHMSPFIAEWKGTQTPVMMLAGRRGQVITFDLFDNNQGNYNVAIAGASGSGKSVFVNDIASSYASVGGKVWIIDVGRSYVNLCEAFDGDFIEFTPDKHLCVNPFTYVVDLAEEMELLQPLIALMVSPKQELDNYTYSVIARAIAKVWELRGNDACMTDIYDLVKTGRIDADDQPDQRVKDLASMIYPFTRHGAYGRYFDGPANIAFKNRFTVLEMEELNTKKDLRTVILYIMMFRITYDMYLSDRAQRKIVIIDEAWDLLGAQGGSDSAASAKFIDAGYRRARKYGGSFITATQNMSDYEMSGAASSALKNSDWRCYLRQKSESLEAMKSKGQFNDDPAFFNTLQSLRTEKDVFSEVLISGPGGKAVARCYMDPYNLLRASSNPSDFTELRRRREAGLSLHEAIVDVLRARGKE
jgi:conjugal transfer ATP-binding protein TraC